MMPDDHGVRVAVEESPDCFILFVGDANLRVIRDAPHGRVYKFATDIRKAIEAARGEALDEAIAVVQPGMSLRSIRGYIEQLKDRNDGD